MSFIHVQSRCTVALAAVLITACGGDGFGLQGVSAQNLTAGDLALAPTPLVPTPPPPGVIEPGQPAPVSAVGAKITDMRIRNLAPVAQTQVPLTFGQVFAPGVLPAATTLSGQLGNGFAVPLQVEVKATHPDGSARHAIISAMLPTLAAGQTQTVSLFRSAASADAAASATAPSPADVLAAGFTTSINLTVAGETYRASADELLKSGKYTTWLSGRFANEWLIVAPLKNAQGVEHPHLQARFALRAVGNPVRVRVDVTVENNWAYEAGPKNQTYDVALLINGTPAYGKTSMLHYHHARWRKTFWSGTEPQVQVMHDPAYLIGTRAIANYDQRIVVAETALAAYQSGSTGPAMEPMATGLATPYMGETGARPDIGLLPGWSANYVLSMDVRARDAMLNTANLAGSWSSHFRDRDTGRPISLADHPYMTLLGNRGDTFNPATGKYEAFPDCGGDCKSPNFSDSAHQPAFNYLPYLLTGDYYQLEELQFWTMFNLFQSNPGYRETSKGLFNRDQVRGQAWSMRTLGEAAFITPDDDPLKPQLKQFLDNNLDWYNKTYTDNANANRLGVLTNGYAIVYDDSIGLAPWQDDFFTQAIGHVSDLGFSKAQSLLRWKAHFAIGRMTDPEYCWIMGAVYSMKVRSSATADLYPTFGEAYRATVQPGFADLACASPAMATKLGLKTGEMTGYAYGATGYPSNLQPALAYAAEVGGSAGSAAWQVFDARPVKPDYSSDPQFAIVPRKPVP